MSGLTGFASVLEVASAGVFFGRVAVGLGVAGTILGALVSKGKKRTDYLMGSIACAMARLAEPAVSAPPAHHGFRGSDT